MADANDTPIDEAPIEAVPIDLVQFALIYRFIEFVSTASHVGKSMLSTFVALLLRQLGHKVLVVRIESKAVRSPLTDIHIASEDFADAARLPGGEVAVLRPLYDALQKAAQDDAKPVVIVDWAGGLSSHRAKIFAATRFDDRLADVGMRGRTMVLTTSLSDRMRQAAELIGQTRTITPTLDVALVLNRRVGHFRFVEGSDERQIHEELLKAAKGCPVIKIPPITGETWKVCEAAGLSMTDTIELPLRELAQRLGGENAWLASAFQMQVAAWWQSSEREMLRALGAANAAAPR
jgi:hypothetical protein